jgi:hypothetical protein
VEGSRIDMTRDTVAVFALSDWRESQNFRVVSAALGTKHLPNKSQKRYFRRLMYLNKVTYVHAE